MNRMNHIWCDACQRLVGYQLGSQPMPTVYCSDCKEIAEAKEQEREQTSAIYRHALNR